jgi:hypothetical protein
MDEGWEKKVRERAYTIWEQQGHSEGHAEQFWDMAERQLLGEGHRPGRKRTRHEPTRSWTKPWRSRSRPATRRRGRAENSLPQLTAASAGCRTRLCARG